MIQDVGMKQAKIQTVLAIKVLGPNKIECSSSINWNAPEFKFDENKLMLKTCVYEYQDLLELRNTLALKLEEVSEIF